VSNLNPLTLTKTTILEDFAFGGIQTILNFVKRLYFGFIEKEVLKKRFLQPTIVYSIKVGFTPPVETRSIELNARQATV